MSVRHENQCVGCPPEMGCLGSVCPNRNVAIFTCDRCDEDIEGEVFEVDDEDLCEDCLRKRFRKEWY